MLTLYTTPLSANGRKPLAVSHHLGLQPAVKLVNVYAGEGRSPEYLAVNPLGKVPALVDGDLTLTESNATAVYLAEAHGGDRLWSREPKRRAEIAQWLYWEASQWQPALVALPGLTRAVAGLLGLPAGDAQAEVRWSDPAFARLVRFLDDGLQARRFVAGDDLTVADFCVAGMMTYARRTRFPFDDYPGVARWYESIESLGAWKATASGPWIADAPHP